jgi:phosphohistidine swiveling domain-containing protein
MTIGKERDYRLSFEAHGISSLVADVCMQGYNGIDVLDFTRRGVFYQYFSETACERYAQEGLALYRDEQTFTQFIHTLTQLQERGEQLAVKTLTAPTCSSQDIRSLFQTWIEYSRLYFQFGIEYLEGVALHTEEQVLTQHLAIVESIKNPARDYITRAFISENSHLVQTVTKLATQFNLSASDLLEYTVDEIYRLFDEQRVSPTVLAERRQAFIAQAKECTYEYSWGAEAEALIVDFLSDSKSVKADHVDGIVANRSTNVVCGRVVLLQVDYRNFGPTTAKMAAMSEGSVLISHATAPELMVACRKAAAIVTDLGGLVSHAAIVSRELNIPCIVGTKHATKIFKDGDMVEVDTQTGVVRKIS